MYENTEDNLGLDLTPFVNAASSGADSYARIRNADAAVAAARRSSAPAPTVHQVGAQRRSMSPMTMLILGAVAVGGFFVVRRAFGRRR